MKLRLGRIFALTCMLLLAAGLITVFVFSLQVGTNATILALLGMVLSFALAPILHEWGHIGFAELADMECVYAKFFCFKTYMKEGELQFGFASPFAPDETQVMPRSGGKMKARVTLYALGGLILEGIFLALVLTAWLLLREKGEISYLFLGALPYAGYLFLLNVVPAEYAGGKTDMQVCFGVWTGKDAEKVMLSAMEIQGLSYTGKSFAEIDEKLYFDVPQLCEDEPLFAIMLDLRYRYYLDKNEVEKAAAQLNRLAQLQGYLPENVVEKIAAELVYMHALRGDFESAEESGKLCKNFLLSKNCTAKRILLAYTKAFGKEENLEPLWDQADELLQIERNHGIVKFEESLIDRLFEE